MQLLVVVLVLVLLFGAAKLPTMARSLGRSMRIFKSEMTEMKKDGSTHSVSAEPVVATDRNTLKAPTTNDD